MDAPIRKAILTAAGRDQRRLPLQTLVDRRGRPTTALQLLLEEAASADVERVALVLCPGDEDAFLEAAGSHAKSVEILQQPEPLGYGHALWLARDFAGDEKVLHLVGDHLFVARDTRSCAAQITEIARVENCAVTAVQPLREGRLASYGAVGGKPVAGRDGTYSVERVLEKPSPTLAEQELVVPGMRAGHYLCVFGMHVLTPGVFSILEEGRAATGSVPHLSEALHELAARERYLAHVCKGTRFDLGTRYGLLFTQLSLALEGDDRERVLSELLELFAGRELSVA